jgi:hypothetical protein
MAYFTHYFDTIIVKHLVGKYFYTVVFLPDTIAKELPFDVSSRLRVEADVSGVPVKGAWQPASGRWYLMLPKQPLKTAGLAVGHAVEVGFRLVPQDHVDLPPEIEELLRSKPKVNAAWTALSAGKQRAFAHRVDGAKLTATRLARVKQVEGMLLGEIPLPWIMTSQRRKKDSE